MAASLLLGDVCVLKENISMNVPKDEAALAQEAAKSSLKLVSPLCGHCSLGLLSASAQCPKPSLLPDQGMRYLK